MLNARNILGNFSVAVVAQGIALIGSVVTTLLVPKVLGVTQFGFWQLFVFYGSYTGFFHLGLNDGVYLLNGGISRGEIDKRSVNSQFAVGLLYQALLSVLVFAGAVVASPGPERLFVLAMTGLYLLVTNAGGFIGFVLQAMDETRLYSAYSALSASLFLVPLVVMLAMGVDSFEPYVVFYTVSKGVGLLFCFWWVRDFIPAGLLSVREALKATGKSVSVGVKLMLANIASMLILGASRFLIDAQWGIDVFSVVSFALSMVSFFLLFASQASMVLFPALRKASPTESASFFVAAQKALDLFLPVCYLLYFPAVAILGWWLPKYEPSFIYFAYLLPVAVFNGKMNMLGNTYLLVLRREGMLLVVNMVTVVFSFAGAALGAYVFHSIEVMLVFAVVALMLRSVYVERFLQRQFKVQGSRLFWGTLALTVAFVCFTVALKAPLALALTCGCYAVFVLLNRKEALAVVGQLRRVIS